MVQFVSEEKRSILRQSLTQMTNLCQFRDPLRVVVARRMARPLPGITQLVQGAPQGLARDPRAALRRQLQRERLTTPAGAAPPVGLWRPLEQGDERPLPGKQFGRRNGIRRRAPSVPARLALVSRDGAINSRTRAEEIGRNLRRRAPGATQEQDVESEQVAIAGLPQFAEHPLLFFNRYLKYRFSRHRQFFLAHQFGCTN